MVDNTESKGIQKCTWKIENREKNRTLERERKKRLTTAVEELQSQLPSQYVVEILSKLNIKTPKKDYRLPQYLILEAVVEYISEIQESRENCATKETQTEAKSCRSVFVQHCTSVVNTQAQTTSVKTRSADCQTIETTTTRQEPGISIRKKKQALNQQQSESPSKNSFNIHSLIGADKKVIKRLGIGLEIKSNKSKRDNQHEIPHNNLEQYQNQGQDWRPWNVGQPKQTCERSSGIEPKRDLQKRKNSGTSHMIENVVGPSPKSIRSDPLKAIPLPEAKLALVQRPCIKRSQERTESTFWSQINPTEGSKKIKAKPPINNPKPKQFEPSSQGNGTSVQAEIRANPPNYPVMDNKLNQNFDFSINSLFGDTIDDFNWLSTPNNFGHLRESNQTKKTQTTYNQFNLPQPFDEEQARGWNEWYPYNLGHDSMHNYHYPPPNSLVPNSFLDHNNYETYKQPSSHNISQILNQTPS